MCDYSGFPNAGPRSSDLATSNIHLVGVQQIYQWLLRFFRERVKYGQWEKLDARLGVSAMRSITEEAGDVLEAAGAELGSSTRQ